MKRLLLLAVTQLGACGPVAVPDRPQPTNPGPSAPPYTVPASVSVAVVSLQAGTITELPLTPTPDLLPAPQLPPVTSGGSDCLVVFKRTPTQQIASLDQASCKGELIWLDVWQGEVLLVSYGITTDNQVIMTSDVEISREDGGLIVHEVGAALAPQATDGLEIWSS